MEAANFKEICLFFSATASTRLPVIFTENGQIAQTTAQGGRINLLGKLRPIRFYSIQKALGRLFAIVSKSIYQFQLFEKPGGINLQPTANPGAIYYNGIKRGPVICSPH